MYLARKRIGEKTHFLLRESFREGGRYLHRDLFDLGENPSEFIEYPGGNSFHFNDRLTAALRSRGINAGSLKLERVFLPWLPPHIRRVVEQMSRLKTKSRGNLTREAMTRGQARIHIFDRRRFFYLRFGRPESPAVMKRPHRFLNVLLEKSRDETEYFYQEMEDKLPPAERKYYVYLTLDLASQFNGHTARQSPLGLDPERLDQVFLDLLCRLNRDPEFVKADPGDGFLSDYLVHYAVWWFDYEFGRIPGPGRISGDFFHYHSRYRQPSAPDHGPDLARAIRVFGLDPEEWRKMSREDLTRIYHRQAMQLHPDQGGDPEAFIELSQAYERLARDK